MRTPCTSRCTGRRGNWGFGNFYEPKPGSGFVSQFIDAAFNENIFLWDTCFLTMFCNYGHPLIPGIGSLDNFYAKQHGDGEICREINRTTGRDFAAWVNRGQKNLFSRWGDFTVTYVGRDGPEPPPHLTLDALNHPILAWAELESVRVTGDRSRLEDSSTSLWCHYYRALQNYVRQSNGLYMTDWASMDNSPRNPYLGQGRHGSGYVIANGPFRQPSRQDRRSAGKEKRCRWRSASEAVELARIINTKMWNRRAEVLFRPDQSTANSRRSKTVAAFWTLLAGVASPEQADDLAAELRSPQSFGRKHRVPSTPADQAGFDPAGGYWRGSVWPSTNTMIIRGLERYGKHDLAREIALEHLRMVGEVFGTTGTVWENYAPDAAKPGQPAKGDFVGWTGIVPIVYFLEYGIGLKPDAPNNRLTWTLAPKNAVVASGSASMATLLRLLAEPSATEPGVIRLVVDSDGDFQLCVRRRSGGNSTMPSSRAKTFGRFAGRRRLVAVTERVAQFPEGRHPACLEKSGETPALRSAKWVSTFCPSAPKERRFLVRCLPHPPRPTCRDGACRR